MKLRTQVLVVAVLFALATWVHAAPPSVDGTYKLKSRTLPDGTTIGEQDLHGVLSLHNGLRNFNVGWATPDGKHFSYSVISTYKFTETDFTETVLISVMNDEIGLMPGATPGSGPVYVMNQTKTVPIKVEGSKVSYQPPFDVPMLTFDGDKMTGSLEGAFVDHWEKVK